MTGDDATFIGRAWSDDLVDWERSPTNPEFGPSDSGGWDSFRVLDPTVLVHEDRLMMWYSGRPDDDLGRVGFAGQDSIDLP